MVKKYVIEARCHFADCYRPAVRSWLGRYYCARHDPSPAPLGKAKESAPERSAAERAKKTTAQRRWREKKRKEHAELVALHKLKPESEQNGMSRYIGFDEDDER